VIDTNVFISGIFWRGNPGKIVDLWKKGEILVFISPSILTEFVLILERFQIDRQKIGRFKKFIENKSVKILPNKKVKVCKDKKDNKFLEVAWRAKADYLITGDKKHLLSLKEFKGTKILSPREFLRVYKKG